MQGYNKVRQLQRDKVSRGSLIKMFYASPNPVLSKIVTQMHRNLVGTLMFSNYGTNLAKVPTYYF